MKYNISLNQVELSKTTMDLIDCAILDWIIDICTSVSSNVIRNKVDGYTWIDYGTLLKQMPLLRIKSKGALTPRIKRICENGFIESMQINREKMYVKITEKINSLKYEEDLSVHETKRSNTKIVSKVIKDKKQYGEFLKVKLTDEEYTKLVERITETNTLLLIAELDSYIESTGKKYSSHYATLLNWFRRKLIDHKKNKNNIAF